MNTNIIEKINKISDEWEDFSSKSVSYISDVKDLKLEVNNLKKNVSKIINSDSRPEINFSENKSCNLEKFIKSDGVFLKKSLNSESDEAGGMVVESSKYKHIIDLITEKSPIRKIASVETISSNSLELILSDGKFESGWVSETELRTDTRNADFSQKKILVHELFAQPKASQRLLSDSFVNVEKWLTEKISDSFSKMENEAFVNGNGNNKPRGFLSYSDQIENIRLQEAGKISDSDILNLLNSLNHSYVSNAHFVMHRKTLSEIQKIKDNNGRFIWQASLSEKLKDSIFGIPVICCDEMSAPEEEKICIALGDFKSAYKIVDRHGINIMKDPFTEKPFVKFYATKRVGGDVVNFDALKFLKF